MAEFFTSFLSGSWLAAFASWIWNTIFAGGTAWSWSLYVSTWGHAGLLWWLWAFFVLILALILIAYIWIAGVLLYSFWLLAAFAWIIIWVIYLFAMLVIWFSRGFCGCFLSGSGHTSSFSSRPLCYQSFLRSSS